MMFAARELFMYVSIASLRGGQGVQAAPRRNGAGLEVDAAVREVALALLNTSLKSRLTHLTHHTCNTSGAELWRRESGSPEATVVWES